MTVARTSQGAVLGVARGGVHAFLGIPYAAPPVGALRYRSPRAASAWNGVRDAVVPGPASIQTLSGASAWLYDSAEPQGEDCLYLNVWTPAPEGRRPVMVWLHGGGWRTGHGAVGATDGTALARRGDVVVVTLNYRLGVLGWLAHPDLRDTDTGTYANWGLQDQIAALRWVRANIAAFGGDPANVTLFGESAGGSSVASILHDPANAGLAHKAIIESGSLHGAPVFPEPDIAAAYAEALAERLSTRVVGLRDVPARLLYETELVLSRERATPRFGRAPVLPVRDAMVLRDWPRDGALPPVPLLIGTNRDEAAFWFDLVNPDGSPVPGFDPPEDEAAMLAMIGDAMALYRSDSRATPDAVAAAYRGGDVKSTWLAIYTDIVFRLRALECAERHAASGHPTFLYEFAHPLAPPARGTPHTAEIPFVFATFATAFFADKVGHDEIAASVSNLMLEAWARFAWTGVPGAEASGEWVRLRSDRRAVNVIGAPGVLYAVQAPAQRAVWTSV
ncbi:MAG TPA: carboxylesterase family protein [Acetobacteraceae bacterium]